MDINVKNLKTVELFAGIGGFRVATDKLGIKTIWANDIEDNACKVYRDRFGDKELVQGDINTLLDSIPPHQLLTGGFPCQPFSSAGKKKVFKILAGHYLKQSSRY
jgi:DNA (cytosine-5)-methyltransferase 1